MARGKVAAQRGAGNRDPWASMSSNKNAASNQVRFKDAGPDSKVNVKAVGNAKIGGNSKGTGTEGTPTAVALRGKRKLGVKMPANY